ncbi:unnamed protein product, partial [Adineta steineri]
MIHDHLLLSIKHLHFFLLKPCIEQLPPTIANCSGNSPHLPMVIACGQLDEQLKKDLLVVGTNTNITAYDID